MVKFESAEKRSRTVLFSSLVTSIILAFIFLAGAFFSNTSREGIAYSQVDMGAGSIFVFVITLIISLSLMPKVMDQLENRENRGELGK